MHINVKPTHLGHPVSKGLQRFIDNLPNPTFQKHIDGLSGEEEYRALQQLERDQEEQEIEDDNAYDEAVDNGELEEELPDGTEDLSYL